MRLNIVTKSPVPEPPYDYELVCIPVQALPYAFSALRIHRAKYWYESEADWLRGIDLLSQLESALLMPCNEIVNAINRLYVLQRAVYQGIPTTTMGDGTDANPFVYSPAITQGADNNEHYQPSLVSAAQETQALILNLADGTPSTLTPETRNIRDLLERIAIAAEATDADQEDLESLLNLVLLALG